jgi:hypothetical protein
MNSASRKVTPLVRRKMLLVPGTLSNQLIPVGAPAWYEWLATARSFLFIGEGGTFIARTERRQRGGRYWQAYRTAQGRRVRGYLGASERLTYERLEQVALALSARCACMGQASMRPAATPDETSAAGPSQIAPTADHLVELSSRASLDRPDPALLPTAEPLLVTKVSIAIDTSGVLRQFSPRPNGGGTWDAWNLSYGNGILIAGDPTAGPYGSVLVAGAA